MTVWVRAGFQVGAMLYCWLSAAAAVITGRVSMPHGRAIPETVRLRLLTPGGQEKQSVFTDPCGSFRFPVVEAGDYVIAAEATGLARTEVRVSVPAGREVQQRLLIELTPPVRGNGSPSKLTTVRVSDLTADRVVRKHFEKGLALAARGRWNDSATELARALEREPAFFPAALHRGIALGKTGRVDDARAQLRRAILLCVTCPEGYVALSQVESSSGNSGPALAVLLQGQQRIPRSYAILLEACRIQFDTNNLEAAAALCRLAHETGGAAVPEAHLLLAKIFHLRRMELEVGEELKAYLEEAPNSQTARMIREQLEAQFVTGPH